MRPTLLFLFAILISMDICSQELMTETMFTRYLQEEVAKSDQKLNMVFFDDLVLGSKFNNLSFLHSLKESYPEYISNPERLTTIVNGLITRIDSIYAPELNHRIDTTKIVPVLKPKAFLKTVSTYDEGEVVYDNFNNELIIVYVEDQDSGYQGYRFFSKNELERIDYNRERIRTLAIRNLQALLSDLSEYILEQEGYRMYRTVGADGGGKYLSSLVLLPDFLRQEQKRVKQNFVVGIPKENQLIVVAKKNKVGLREIKKYAAANYYLTEAELITKHLFLWDGTEFKRL